MRMHPVVGAGGAWLSQADRAFGRHGRHVRGTGVSQYAVGRAGSRARAAAIADDRLCSRHPTTDEQYGRTRVIAAAASAAASA